MNDTASGTPLIIWSNSWRGKVFWHARNNVPSDKIFLKIFSPCSLFSLLPIYFLFKLKRNFSLPVLLHYFEVTILQYSQQQRDFISHSYIYKFKLGFTFTLKKEEEDNYPLKEIRVDKLPLTYQSINQILRIQTCHKDHFHVGVILNEENFDVGSLATLDGGPPLRFLAPNSQRRDSPPPPTPPVQLSRKSSNRSSSPQVNCTKDKDLSNTLSCKDIWGN